MNSSPQPPTPTPAGGNVGVVDRPAGNQTIPDPLLADNQSLPVKQVEAGKPAAGEGKLAELEKKYQDLLSDYTEKTQELSLLRQTLESLAPNPPVSNPNTGQSAPIGEEPVEKFVSSVVDKKISGIQYLLNKMAVQSNHPELRDPAFNKELMEFLKSIPMEVRRRLEPTPEGASWVVKLFKDFKSKVAAETSPKAPYMEQPGARGEGQVTGPILSRAKISELRRTNIEEYKRRQAEILAAYQEGRVVD